MKNFRKVLVVGLALAMAAGCLAGCGDKGKAASSSGDSGKAISILSREEGSGTRGAFVELLGIETKDADGNKVDQTIDSAEITNSTSVMIQTVAGNDAAIGYISLGSLDDSVKALKVDGVEATTANVKSGDYKVARPFNIVVKNKISNAAQDFIDYIMSEEGQAIVEQEGYVSKENTGAFNGKKVSGKIAVSGSSSVTPVMQKLAEEYQKINKTVTIDVQQSDSTTGITDAIEGNSDIGMASRDVSSEELAKGITAKSIAMDGIAIIVNKSNQLGEIAAETVRKIYTGEITDWANVK